MIRFPKKWAATSVAASVLICPAAASAQDGGLEAGATLGFGVLYEDDEWSTRGDFGVSLRSITRTEQFTLSLGTALEYPDINDDARFVDPAVELGYTRLGANADLAVSAAFQRSEIDTLVVEETPGVGDIQSVQELVSDTGRRSTTELGSRLTFGKQSRIGGAVGVDLGSVRYSETDSTAFNDFDTRSADLLLRFSLDPRIDLRLTAAADETLSEGTGTDRTSRSVGLGADFEIDKITRASLDVSYVEIETSEGGGPVTTDSGPGVALALIRTRPDGELRFDLSSIVTTDGTRVESTVARSRELRLGSFEWSAGLSQGGDGETNGIFDLAYARQSKTATFSASLERAVQADVFGDEYLIDQASLSYRLALSDVAALESGLSYRNTDFLDPDSDEIEKVSISVGYTHQITQDVGLVTSLSHTRTWTGSEDADSENALYLGLERSLSWRP